MAIRSSKKPLLSIAAFVFGLLLLFAHSSAAENALPADVAAIFEKATAIELFSIDPYSHIEGKTGLEAYKSLGTTTLKPDEAKAAYTALKNSIKNDNEPPAKCFDPRHALKATVDGKTAIILVCFACNQGYAYIVDAQTNHGKYFRPGLAAKAPFNKILSDAKIPLAESATKD